MHWKFIIILLILKHVIEAWAAQLQAYKFLLLTSIDPF